jgi:hypothetical protein
MGGGMQRPAPISVRVSDQEMHMKPSQPRLSRRIVFAGAGTAGALAAVAALLPGKPEATAAVKPVVDVDKTAGYQETPHVLHYYRTARI